MSSSSLVATNSSFASCSFEMSKLVTLAPAAARTGACWPPPDARQSTRLPSTPSNQVGGTHRFGVRITFQWPLRAFLIVDSSTGRHHGLDPLRDSASHASLLCRWISTIYLHCHLQRPTGDAVLRPAPSWAGRRPDTCRGCRGRGEHRRRCPIFSARSSLCRRLSCLSLNVHGLAPGSGPF